MAWTFESLVLVPLRFCLGSKYTFMHYLNPSTEPQVTEIISIIVEVFFGLLKANNIVTEWKKGRNRYVFPMNLTKCLARKTVFEDLSK